MRIPTSSTSTTTATTTTMWTRTRTTIRIRTPTKADKAGKASDSAKTSPGVPPELGDLVEKWKKWDPNTATRLADPERKEALALVREELIDVLRDSAHSLTELAPDERIAIAIFPSDLDWRGPGTRTVLEVRRRDVDAYQRGELTAEAFAARVQVENP